jgi:hypothetical protein
VQEPAQDVVIETWRETSRLGQSMSSIKRDRSRCADAAQESMSPLEAQSYEIRLEDSNRTSNHIRPSVERSALAV